MSAKPKISYFSICGRGMMSRLVATAGEVDFEENVWDPSFDETGGWRQGYAAIGNALGFPGVMPILEHGDFKLFQSVAIEGYLASLSPKFSALTPAQKGTDLMFQEIRSDINAATESLLFKKIEAEALPPIMEKSYAMVEGLLPESGFINGLDFPTPADLAVLVITKGDPTEAVPARSLAAPLPRCRLRRLLTSERAVCNAVCVLLQAACPSARRLTSPAARRRRTSTQRCSASRTPRPRTSPSPSTSKRRRSLRRTPSV